MRLTSDEIFYLNELNSASGANARDCVVQGNVITFLIRKEELGKAIGKDASSVKKLRLRLKLNVELLEYAEDVVEFIKKALYNARVREIGFSERDGKKVANVTLEPGERRKLLNQAGRLKRIKALAQRNYKVEDIKIH
jgi:N utilization substance protein A